MEWPSVRASSHASGGLPSRPTLLARWGCRAFTDSGNWFQLQWLPGWEGVHITVKELLPIVIGCAVWGDRWKGETVRCVCDNAAVVAIIKSGSSRDKRVMHLMRCLFFFTAIHQIVLAPSHIPGKLNTAADMLSRDGLSSFLQLVPEAKSQPSLLPQELLEALVLEQPDWTSESWRSALRSDPPSARIYKSGENRFLRFCDSCHVTPLPVSEDVLCKYVSHLADSDLKHRTIKTYLSGGRYYQIRSGFPDPFQSSHMPRLDYTLRGVKRVQAQKGGTRRSRLPITPSLLRLMKGVWAPSAGRDEKMIWAACCLAFFGFLRIREMTVPDGSGFVGRANSDLCRVAAVLSYLTCRGTGPGPLFVLEGGQGLTRSRFVSLVRSALDKVGVDQSAYCGHSFRIGAATTAAARGIEDSVIKTLGRWESLAYLQHVRIPRRQLVGYSSLLRARESSTPSKKQHPRLCVEFCWF